MRVPQENLKRLLATPVSSADSEYLSFLARRVPTDLVHQLNRDLQPELKLSQSIAIDDILGPLSSGSFPNANLFEFTSLLNEGIFYYNVCIREDPNSDNPFKLVYVVSLYLKGLVDACGKGFSRAYPLAIGILARTASKLDLESRLQVARFLSRLIPDIAVTDTDVEYIQTSSAIMTLSILLASILVDLSEPTAETMTAEHIHDAWQDDDLGMLSNLKTAFCNLFAPSGDLSKAISLVFNASALPHCSVTMDDRK